MSSIVIGLPWVRIPRVLRSAQPATASSPMSSRGHPCWRIRKGLHHHHLFIIWFSVSLFLCKLMLSWFSMRSNVRSIADGLKDFRKQRMHENFSLDLVTQPYPSVWHHFPLIIYQSQTQNPKRSNELTKTKCELCLTSQNLQFHFSTACLVELLEWEDAEMWFHASRVKPIPVCLHHHHQHQHYHHHNQYLCLYHHNNFVIPTLRYFRPLVCFCQNLAPFLICLHCFVSVWSY